MKRKILLRLFALVAATMCALGASAAEAYANYTPSNTTLTFYYDNLRSTRSGTTYDMNVGSQSPDWYFDNSYSSVTKVVFNSSFADARPVSTCRWFVGMTNLQSITGMQYLNTSLVLNMSAMFQQCEVLGSVDVSHFNTARVTDMSHMFYSCKKLTSIDVSSFNTANVTNMYRMFGYCSQVTSLNLSSFNTANVTNMKEMFYACPVLTTIYVNSGWSTASVTNSTDMFKTCYNLVGGMGTAYNSSHVDKGYAHIDVGPSNPGYLSCNLPAEPYAEYTPDNTTLTFHYDNVRAYRTGTTYNLNTGSNLPGWYDIRTSISQVVFDSSFANARPTTTSRWFYDMSNLESITGMKEYLNTSVVTNMSYMFLKCTSLTSLDVSRFNTSQVTNMSYMFYKCSSLTSLDLSSFNTANVTDMQLMFYGCSSLTSLDVSSFNTANVTDMRLMFNGCRFLTSLDLRSFNTANVTNMGEMFRQCYNLTSLNLISFNTAKVTSMSEMFYYCVSLETIYVGREWSTAAVTSSSDMFKGCSKLIGGMGTTYIASHVDAEYAHIDGGPSNPGYLSEWKEAYVCRTTTSVTFYYDDQRSNHTEGSTYSLGSLGWTSGNNQAIMHITIDPSFADARPTSTARWFYNFPQLKSISGLQYLNTSEVTDMTSMFSHCHIMGGCPDLSTFSTVKVTSMASMFDNFWGNNDMLDLSSFNTGNVTDMSNMFCNSYYLVGNLDLSNFNTANVTNMNGMFNGCRGLTALDVSSFNTANVTDMRFMFYDCSGLTSLDLSSFNTANVTDMAYMFYNDTSLINITVGEGWNTDAVTSSDMMFNDCTKLVGGKGTTYDANHVDAAYAHIDGGIANPGYFTAEGAEPWTEPEPEAYACYTPSDSTLTFYFDNQRSNRTGTTYDLNTNPVYPRWYSDRIMSSVKSVVFDPSFAGARPIITSYWFYAFSSLDSITGLEYLNTVDVTDMRYMFANTSKLKSLDLSSFNTANVTDMSYMFSGSNFTSLDLSSFNTANVTDMRYMFNACRLLASLDVSSFNTANVTSMLNMFYDCRALTSLDVSSFNTANVTEMAGMFRQCYKLTSLDVSSFNTANVTIMYYMFASCSKLTSLDVSSFNSAKVTNMNYMFYNCPLLATIYAGEGWNTDAVTSSTDMFKNSTSLVGGMGTTYDADHLDKEYAHIDGGSSKPGYFTAKVNFTRGDVNGDGDVNISDAIMLINYLLNDAAEGINLDAANVNEDSEVNISDAVSLINFLLNDAW